jgi:Tol biopolymer transport system component/predicted Ser/Thr protein kinase
MPLESGMRLGSYEITRRLAAGGMGEVYVATDTRLGRAVAIKALPAAFASDADRLARFEREAKILASLNHAHIAAVYGLDEHEGMRFIAMELVEGESLEQRLRSGALPVEEALQLALQIATALEAAHGKGIVHRDLKPANVMVTPDHVVKVLDFGLAKAFMGEPGEGSPAHSPSLSLAMTQQGLILGTAAYMSPEQASGQATDQRADIWAFGVVLYEMLTGHSLFAGESAPHILASVLKSDPDWSRLPNDLHPRIRLLLERCLEKKVRNRYHSIADARVDIEKALADPEGARPVRAQPSAQLVSIARWGVVLTGLIVLGGLIVGGMAVLTGPPMPTSLTVTFDVAPPEGVNLDLTIWRIPFAISPDSRQLVFAGKSGAGRRLYLRPLGAPDAEARPIPDTEGALDPSWSPDSEWVGFLVGDLLKRARVAGGEPVVETVTSGITRVVASRDWGKSDQILFGAGLGTGGITRIAANGGSATHVFGVDAVPGARALRSPVFVGDDSHFLFVSESDTAALYVGSMDGAAPVELMKFSTSTGSSLDYAGGDVFYVERSVLWARAFDAETLRFTGEPRRVLEGIPVAPFSSAPFSVSDDGVVAYRKHPLTERVEFRWYDRQGTPGAKVGEPVYIDGFDLSADGRQLALGRVVASGAVELWHHDLDSNSLRPLVLGQLETVPRFASDGAGLLFTGRRPGDPANPTRLYLLSLADQSQELLNVSGANLLAQSWNRENDDIVYAGFTTGWDIYRKHRTEGDAVRLPLNTDFAEHFSSLSPDGRLLAFTTNESGEPQLWLASYPEGRRIRQLSRGFAVEPDWSADGTELYYIGADRMLTAVTVTMTEPGTVVTGDPEPLFRLDDAVDVATQYDAVRRVFAAGPDGRFLVATRAPPERDPISILIGWDDR